MLKFSGMHPPVFFKIIIYCKPKTTTMRKKISFAVILLVCLAGCQSKSAFNYSQNFVKKEQSLLPEINTTETNIGRYGIAQQFDSLAIAAERMEKLVDEKLKEIKDEPAPDAKEADNFKEAGIKYFSYIKSMYTSYKNYGLAKTPEDREEGMRKIQEVIAAKTAAIEDMQKVQKKYADANGFKLENKYK
jgi:hypothetical protein